ncbi:MAG TPA: hypothetical protein VFF73_13010 [Planctomycetota bacterium]|nr:hypothetical protein [Planctomycetota bacterium]
MLVHEGGFRVEKDGAGFRFFDRWGGAIPAVPEAHAVQGQVSDLAPVDATTNAPRWDGSALDYGAAVSGLLGEVRDPSSAA